MVTTISATKRFFVFLLTGLLLSVACTRKKAVNTTNADELRRLREEVDSLKRQGKISDSSLEVENNISRAFPQTNPPDSTRLRLGEHAFTLQWISWDEPGSVLIEGSEEGWYTIEGEQRSKRNDDYITIKGILKPVSKTELLFRGEIKSQVETINKGEPCVRTGSKVFKITKNRKYWRLQDMLNCEGNMVTDYIDIYF